MAKKLLEILHIHPCYLAEMYKSGELEAEYFYSILK